MKTVKKAIVRFFNWFANDNRYEEYENTPETIDWFRISPFLIMQVACLCVFWVGFSWTAFTTALVLYFLRLFSIGGFYHRYFSHKTFQTNRFWQFIFGVIGVASVQRGPLWWASHHRQHHMVSDQPEDVHSPKQHGFWWSHMGWFMSRKHFLYNPDRVKDLSKYPELVLLDRFDVFIPIFLFISLFAAGWLLKIYAPQLHTTPWQMVVWGFCISTTALFHSTVVINSLCHVFGRQRFATSDTSRNSFILALLTLGEGWHNNHHYYPATARQGFKWWEIDITFYILKFLELIGVIWDVRGLPKSVLERDLVKSKKATPAVQSEVVTAEAE